MNKVFHLGMRIFTFVSPCRPYKGCVNRTINTFFRQAEVAGRLRLDILHRREFDMETLILTIRIPHPQVPAPIYPVGSLNSCWMSAPWHDVVAAQCIGMLLGLAMS